MSNLTFRNLEEYSKCPYRFKYGRSELQVPSPAEFTDRVVHAAIHRMNDVRLKRRDVTENAALEAYWDAWDDLYFENTAIFSGSADRMDHLRLGEDMMRSYVRMVSRYGAPRILMNGTRSTQPLPGGNVIDVEIDEVCIRGDTVLLCRYVTDVLRTRSDMESDPSMNLAVQWALANIPGVDYAVACWRLLSTGTEFESPTDMDAISRIAADVGREVAVIRSAVSFYPKACDLCVGCPCRSTCPRYAHQDDLESGSVDSENGVAMVDAYRDLEEKKRALKERVAMLDERQRELSASIVEYADSRGYSAVNGTSYYVVVSHQKKVVLPEDKTEVIDHLKRNGTFDRYVMVNYPRLRSDIMRGQVDDTLANMAMVVPDDRLYLKRKS